MPLKCTQTSEKCSVPRHGVFQRSLPTHFTPDLQNQPKPPPPPTTVFFACSSTVPKAPHPSQELLLSHVQNPKHSPKSRDPARVSLLHGHPLRPSVSDSNQDLKRIASEVERGQRQASFSAPIGLPALCPGPPARCPTSHPFLFWLAGFPY